MAVPRGDPIFGHHHTELGHKGHLNSSTLFHAKGTVPDGVVFNRGWTLCPRRGLWQCLGTFWLSQLGQETLVASRGWRPGTPLNSLPSTGRPSHHKEQPSLQVPGQARLRNLLSGQDNCGMSANNHLLTRESVSSETLNPNEKFLH